MGSVVIAGGSGGWRVMGNDDSILSVEVWSSIPVRDECVTGDL